MADHPIELIARGVFVHEGKLLVCRSKQGHVFLPGGHVDFGERAADALEREIREELGIELKATAFLGACEAAFDQTNKSGKTRRHHEVNIVFSLMPASTPFDPTTVVSQEAHIEFVWMPLAEATAQQSPLLPHGIVAVIKNPAKTGWLSVFQ